VDPQTGNEHHRALSMTTSARFHWPSPRRFVSAYAQDLMAADSLNILNDAMPHLPFPHSSQVDGELRELRCHYGRDLYRVLYRRSGTLIVLLHIFAKRTKKIPAADIKLAKKRFDDFKAGWTRTRVCHRGLLATMPPDNYVRTTANL